MGAVLVAVPLVFCLRASLGAATYQYQFSFDPQHARVVEFLQSNTSAEDYVLVVGAESAVNFAAQRESPTRFVYQYALVRPTYGDEERLLEFYTDILDKKPKYIIATRTEDLPVSIGVKQSELVRAAADEVGSRYRLREVIIDWLVWEYVGP